LHSNYITMAITFTMQGSGRIADIVAYAYQNAKWTNAQNEDGSTG